MFFSRREAIVLYCTLALALARHAAAGPQIFWASDPIRPNETVMLHGNDLGGSAAVVDMARLADGAAEMPAAVPEIKTWTHVDVLQGSEQTLKFVAPSTWKPGVFACRVSAAGSISQQWLLNAPDPWWVQGDEGDSATPGGWVRVLGKSLLIGNGPAALLLQRDQGPSIPLQPASADGYSLRFQLPADLQPGRYTVQVHNGGGGAGSWRSAGPFRIASLPAVPSQIFNVLESYGPDAVEKMRSTLIKYNQPMDRTEGILSALKKAKETGGGTVYFPPGRYTVKGPLEIPQHTVLKGEGEGLVTLWWGTGHFNLDGGGPQGRARIDEPPPPHVLIHGPDFAIQNMSLYLPLDYEQGIVADKRLRMDHVRIRIDHYWLVQGRGNGVVCRMGQNSQITHCDILGKGDTLVPGPFSVIAHNRIMSNKSNSPMGGSRCVIVEDNQFVSMDPTAYQNISGTGRNIYYAHNHHEALYAQQSDYSFTFDAGSGAYLGNIAEVQGTQVTLAADPKYPKWAPETHGVWKQSALCIVDGRGAGQWRDIVANHGRLWEIDRPFDVPPDVKSVATIITFNGRVLVIGNQFEDANWVNAGYGTSIDVICAENHLARCADLMHYGLHSDDWAQPSWHVQFFDNQVTEGQTKVSSSGGGHKSELYSGPVTRWAIHRRETLAADNSGSISIDGNVLDAVIEGCALKNSANRIKVDADAKGVVLRNNIFEGSAVSRYSGDGLKNAIVQPDVTTLGR